MLPVGGHQEPCKYGRRIATNCHCPSVRPAHAAMSSLRKPSIQNSASLRSHSTQRPGERAPSSACHRCQRKHTHLLLVLQTLEEKKTSPPYQILCDQPHPTTRRLAIIPMEVLLVWHVVDREAERVGG